MARYNAPRNPNGQFLTTNTDDYANTIKSIKLQVVRWMAKGNKLSKICRRFYNAAIDPDTPLKEALEAAIFLANYSVGKPNQSTDLSITATTTTASIPEERIALLRQLQQPLIVNNIQTGYGTKDITPLIEATYNNQEIVPTIENQDIGTIIKDNAALPLESTPDEKGE